MVAATKNYLYTLPRDLEALQVVATASTLNAALVCASAACHCKHKRAGQHLNTKYGGIQYLVSDFIRTHLSLLIEGHSGTNDEQLFKTTFHTIVPRVYVAFLTFLQKTPEALDSLSLVFGGTLPNHATRWTYFERVAQQYHAAVTSLNTPLTFTWPLLPIAPDEQKGGV